MSIDQKNGINLIETTTNTIWKTIGGIGYAIGIGILLAFTIGIIIGLIFPIIAFIFLLLPKENINFLVGPLSGSYKKWRIKLFIYCWIIGIISWTTIIISTMNMGL